MTTSELLTFLLISTIAATHLANGAGFGASTTGGTGGKTIYVETYEDTGAGSFRYAVQQNGPAIISFAKLFPVSPAPPTMGGVIALKSALKITGSKLTIDGATSPSGITIKDFRVEVSKTSDVIIRNMRFRPGTVEPYSQSSSNRGEDALTVMDSTDILVERCSFSWASDETLSVVRSQDVTLRNNIIGPALSDPSVHVEDGQKQVHPYGSLISANRNVLISSNVYAHCKSRNPQLQGGLQIIVDNNVFFDYWRGTILEPQAWKDKFPSGAVDYQVTNNYYFSSTENKVFDTPVLLYNKPHDSGATIPWSLNKIHISGNMLDGKTVDDQWKGIVNVNGAVINSALKPSDTPIMPSEHAASAIFSYLTRTSRNVGAAPLDPIDLETLTDIRKAKGKWTVLPPSSWSKAGWSNVKATAGVQQLDGSWLGQLVIDCDAANNTCPPVVYEGTAISQADLTADPESTGSGSTLSSATHAMASGMGYAVATCIAAAVALLRLQL